MTDVFKDHPALTYDAYAPNRESDSVAIVSGGMDSVTLVYDMIDNGYRPHLLAFNYGQRHGKELRYAGYAARRFGLMLDVVDLRSMTHLISRSALTSQPEHWRDTAASIEVPEGHYAEDNMAITVVPNRNMIMLSIAAGVAVNNRYKYIATGIHAGDHFQYPDCRPEFIHNVFGTIKIANAGFERLEDMYAPFLYRTKADIAERAFELGVPFHLTWSCYKGGANHCGRCGTCVERLEAIDEAKQRMLARYPETDTVWVDATVYDDTEYWKVVVNTKGKN